jgi:20S proteasome alpha/beta subunit
MPQKPSYKRFFSLCPSPADWINGMTVCVAGICQESIVAVCDMMVSTGDFSADNMALKFRDLHPRWNAFFAGNDITAIIPVIKRAEAIVTGGGSNTLSAITSAMRTAFQEQLIEKQTDTVLARYGLSMPEFLRSGLSYFGEQVFASIKYQIDAINLDCVFLVLGFDDDNNAHIFTVEDPGIISNHDLQGFWAIGSGANRALSSLFFQSYRTSLREWEALYYIGDDLPPEI